MFWGNLWHDPMSPTRKIQASAAQLFEPGKSPPKTVQGGPSMQSFCGGRDRDWGFFGFLSWENRENSPLRGRRDEPRAYKSRRSLRERSVAPSCGMSWASSLTGGLRPAKK